MSTPAPTTEKKSNLLWWLLGLLLVAILVLLLGVVLIGQYVLRTVQVTRDGDLVAVSTPMGELRVDRSAETDPGLPVYPGAEVSDRGGVVELSPPGDDPVFITAARYRTQASLAEVDTWYREQLGQDFQREGPGRTERKGRLFGVDVRSDDVVFLSEGDELMRAVALRRQGLYTEIALVRISRRETL
jgi:hypothetical protein